MKKQLDRVRAALNTLDWIADVEIERSHGGACGLDIRAYVLEAKCALAELGATSLKEVQERSKLAMNPGKFKEDAVKAWRASAEDVPELLRLLGVEDSAEEELCGACEYPIGWFDDCPTCVEWRKENG